MFFRSVRLTRQRRDSGRRRLPVASQVFVSRSNAAACAGSSASQARQLQSVSSDRVSECNRANHNAASARIRAGGPASGSLRAFVFTVDRRVDEQACASDVLFHSADADSAARGDLAVTEAVDAV